MDGCHARRLAASPVNRLYANPARSAMSRYSSGSGYPSDVQALFSPGRTK